jgi:hypothetical protein
MIPASYDLKRIVVQKGHLFWRATELVGIPQAPVYLFEDQERFDSDEVDAIARCIAAEPLRLPHDKVLFEVVDQGPKFCAQVAYVHQTTKGVEAHLLLRSRDLSRWLDVPCSAFFPGDGYAEVEPNPRLSLAPDVEIYGRVISGIVWRALALLSIRPTVIEQPFPRTRRPKLTKLGITGWNWKLVDIDLGKIRLRTLQGGGTHASPRWHIRRGHWRTLADGRRVFVQPCEVGDRARGGIVKDYAVSVGELA